MMAVQHGEQSRPLLDDDDGRRSPDTFEFLTKQTIVNRRRQILFKLAALAHPAHITSLGKRFAYALVPSPIRSLVWDDHAPAPKQFPTSYLNGLRGMTAIKVFTFHYFMAFTDFTHTPWRMDERHDNIMLFPIFRYFWTGFTSQMFFGIAGYLTCLRLFQMLDKNDVTTQAKIFASIVASLFRRGFRLYLPVAVIMFIMAVYIYSGLYETSRPFIQDKEMFPGVWLEHKPPMFSTFYEQMLFWRGEMIHITDVTNPFTFYPDHDQHLWSIIAEMRASLHLYVCLIMFAGCRRYIRLIGLCFMAFVFFIWNRWETWVYILGAIVAQIDIILTERQQLKEQVIPLVEMEKVEEKQAELGSMTLQMRGAAFYTETVAPTGKHISSVSKICIRYALFLLAFHLMSWPIQGDIYYAPGYEELKAMIPWWVDRKDKVYPNIGAGLLIFLLARSDPKRSRWRRLLMSRVPQYLGTISFAMYLVHGPLLHMFGYMIPHRIWWYFETQGSETTNAGWLGAMLVGYSISLVVAWAAADVWTREIEGRLVKFVKHLEAWCFKAKAA